MLLTDRVEIKCEGWSTDKAKYLAEKSRVSQLKDRHVPS